MTQPLSNLREAEEAVLGDMLISGDAALKALADLTPAHFHDDRLRAIFQIMMEVHQQ